LLQLKGSGNASCMHTLALIVAAGSGSRAGSSPKQYQKIVGKALLRHTLDIFLSHPAVDGVAVVIAAGHGKEYAAATKGLALLPPIIGGATRQQSVLAGLEALAAHTPAQVLIHDAARPFTSAESLDLLLQALKKHPAAILATPVADTLKRANNDTIEATLPREHLWQAQTPQGFHFAEILTAHRQAAGKNLTDDAAVAEAAGIPVTLVQGSPTNRKITTKEDIAEAAKLLSLTTSPKTAMGFDVHRLIPSPTGFIRLGGIDIPHTHSLEGHSDADVVLHALTDAILGLIADGDIGVHFSPSDPRWRGMDSTHFLQHAREKLEAAGGSLTHIDLTLIGEQPKIAPHREAIRTRLRDLLDLPLTSISLKATTTEGLGFTGRKEGLAAFAVANALFSRSA
jgi:2-C-methyl-D-erythritol 4-phosphate cytidylyltransferase/2-C-methyl-D-erythritol 2,4-cyclodiphosphate synthase